MDATGQLSDRVQNSGSLGEHGGLGTFRKKARWGTAGNWLPTLRCEGAEGRQQGGRWESWRKERGSGLGASCLRSVSPVVTINGVGLEVAQHRLAGVTKELCFLLHLVPRWKKKRATSPLRLYWRRRRRSLTRGLRENSLQERLLSEDHYLAHT